MQLIITLILAALALIVASRIFSNVELRGDFLTALLVAAGYSILSFLLGWLIFGLLGVVTLGLGFVFHFITQLVTAAIVLKITSAISKNLSIRGFLPALGTALLLALAGELSYRIASSF